MKRSSSLLLAMLLVACSPRVEPADSIAAAPGDLQTVSGVIRVVGSAPVNVQVMLDPGEGRQIRLVGALRDELERLAGMDVTVSGRVTASADPMADRQIEVASYDIGLVDGRSVVVGEIIQISAGEAQLRTPAGDVLYLRGIPNEFRVGQKVWVQGPATLVVQSFGVLRQ
jgi:hypothetical protein